MSDKDQDYGELCEEQLKARYKEIERLEEECRYREAENKELFNENEDLKKAVYNLQAEEIERLNTIINEAFSIADDSPELNMSNYTIDDVDELNQAMIEVWKKLQMFSEEKTRHVHEWMKNLPDDQKQRFAINWRIPHSLFNVACTIYPGGSAELQNVDWYQIFQSRDLGVWSHGGPVYVMAF